MKNGVLTVKEISNVLGYAERQAVYPLLRSGAIQPAALVLCNKRGAESTRLGATPAAVTAYIEALLQREVEKLENIALARLERLTQVMAGGDD